MKRMWWLILLTLAVMLIIAWIVIRVIIPLGVVVMCVVSFIAGYVLAKRT